MSTRSSHDPRAALSVALWLSLATTPAAAQTAPSGKIPELASSTFAWLIIRPEWLPPPAGLRGPIPPDPEQRQHMNQDGAGQVTVRLGNWRDPVLKPWAAEQMRISNEEVITGKRGLPFSAQASCHPGGVPGQLLYPAEPFYFIQTPKVVYMIWQRDHMVRRIYMTDKHSENVKSSWFGESIGRYENGELVVDTIGLSTEKSYIDNYRTPHTEKLHVVERFKPTADDKALEVFVKVTDPDTFYEPLHLVQRWRKVPNPLVETVCAENNSDRFGQNLFQIPRAKKPDF
jgi:hypothetical protein